ncbi:MAG: hypothetical protein HYT42_01505 [Candidatus Sungbacteria bacterium]|nr:hypothetical protein [Candidatus Sungbacteria bacterium]
MNATKKIIGVFFGSRSPEHDISIITASRAMAGLRVLAKYRIVPVYIGKAGDWFSSEALGDIAFFREPRFEESLKPHKVASWSFADGNLFLHQPHLWFKSSEPIRIDLAFPCFHGSFGEDGTIQGLFETAGVPYVGCGVLASSLTMSKTHTRRILRDAGIRTVPTMEISRELFSSSPNQAKNSAAARFSFPMFVKPNALGSSIAVNRTPSDQASR